MNLEILVLALVGDDAGLPRCAVQRRQERLHGLVALEERGDVIQDDDVISVFLDGAEEAPG